MNAAPTQLRGALALPSVDATTLLATRGALVVDLRSPSEFAEDHVPGARNVPLFDDLERALVGTLYRQVSPVAAFEEGRAIVRARVAGLVSAIAEVSGWRVEAGDLEARVAEMTAGGLERMSTQLTCAPARALPAEPVIFHCWRGGLRSRSVVALARELGLERAVVLEGGYKAYRAEVAREIGAWRPTRTFVLRGLTGVGKTLVLRALERVRPGWTIDLEALAGHRSSLLGMVGLEPCSQKMFESRLAARVRDLSRERATGTGPHVVEGESRKVGDVLLPRGLWSAMSEGVAIELVAPLERRIEVLKEDYLASERSRAELLARLPAVEERMKLPPGSPALASRLARGDVDALVRDLLERYYDPLYRHSERGSHYAVTIEATDPVRAASEAAAWIESAAPWIENPAHG